MNKGGIVYGFYMSPEQWQKIPNHTPVPNVYIASNWTQTWHGLGPGQRLVCFAVDPGPGGH